MAEIRTVTTLRREHDEITAVIKLYERQLAQARTDLAHVNVAMRVFEDEDTRDFQTYIDVHRVFSYREKSPLCEAALREHGPMTTEETALHLMEAKGLDTDNNVLARTIANRLIDSPRMQAIRGRVMVIGKRIGVCVWNLRT